MGKLTGQGSSSKYSGRFVLKPIADLRPTIAAGPSQDFLPSPRGTAQDGAHTRCQLCPGAQPGQKICVYVCTGQRGPAFGLPSSYSTLFLAKRSLRPGQLLCTPAIPGLALPGTVPRWPPHRFLLSPFHPRALSMRLRDASAAMSQHCSASGGRLLGPSPTSLPSAACCWSRLLSPGTHTS